MTFFRLMGEPLKLCACCELVETTVVWMNKSICAVCREHCSPPFDQEHCTIYNTLEEDQAARLDSQA